MSESHAPGAQPPIARSDISDMEAVWRFLGLQVGRKTEIIALAAFVLSISGVLWQVFNYTRGPIVRLFATDQIVFSSTDKLGRKYAGQENLLALIATMSYANEGEVGRNAIVRREYIRFSLGNRPVEHRWYQFVTSDVKDGKLEVQRNSEARPFPVNAGSAESRETLFTAWEIDCEQVKGECEPARNFVKWEDFLSTIQKTKRLSFTTSAEIYSLDAVSATCVVRFRDWELKVIEAEQWMAMVCSDATPPTQSKTRRQQGSAAGSQK